MGDNNLHDEIWLEVRSEFYKNAKEECESILHEWLDKIGYGKPIGYYRNLFTREMVIYTTNPGVLIGKAGSSVNEFERMLSEKFCGKWTVRFVEVRGGFYDPMDMKRNKVFEELLSVIDEWRQNSDVVSIDTVYKLIESKGKLYGEI